MILVSHIPSYLDFWFVSLPFPLFLPIQHLQYSLLLQVCYTQFLAPFPQAGRYEQLFQTFLFQVLFVFFFLMWPLGMNYFCFSWKCSKGSWRWLCLTVQGRAREGFFYFCLFFILLFLSPFLCCWQLCGRLLIYVQRLLWYRTPHSNNVIWSTGIECGGVP